MITVAILGAGIGAQHFDAYRKLPERFRVKAVVDLDAQRARALVQGTDTATGVSVPAALRDADVDLIDICLPPHLHAAMTLDALDHGKHVICEKPLATSLRAVENIRQAAQDNDRSVFPVFQYRWGAGLVKLRHLIDAGFAGRPIVASAETHWNRGADYYSVPWRGTWAGEQGGAVLGHAIHIHDLLAHVMGPVSAVSGSLATRVNPIETEDCAALSFEFSNGALATSSVTLGAATDETRLRFVFERLTVTSDTVPYAPGEGVWTFTARDPERQDDLNSALAEVSPACSGFAGFFAAVSDCLAGRGNTSISLEDGAKSIELVTAIYQAARSGRKVALPLPSDSALFEGWQP